MFGCAPYGYTYKAKKISTSGQAQFEINAKEAPVVQQIFGWFATERCTISEVCRRLKSAGIKTQKGNESWSTKTILGMLTNPAYTGLAAFGKRRVGLRRTSFQSGRSVMQKRSSEFACFPVPQDEWIRIPVPALISLDIFELTQRQLCQNRTQARVRKTGARNLLQGLLRCDLCGAGNDSISPAGIAIVQVFCGIE